MVRRYYLQGSLGQISRRWSFGLRGLNWKILKFEKGKFKRSVPYVANGITNSTPHFNFGERKERKFKEILQELPPHWWRKIEVGVKKLTATLTLPSPAREKRKRIHLIKIILCVFVNLGVLPVGKSFASNFTLYFPGSSSLSTSVSTLRPRMS